MASETSRGGTPAPRSANAPAVLAVVAVALSSLRKIFDGDIWWHVRTGQWIVEHRAVPVTDVFSYTAEGPLKYTEALAQLLFYGLHALGGAHALVVGQALVTLGLAFVVKGLAERATQNVVNARRNSRNSAGALAVTVALWGVATSFRFGAKTELFSFLAFALLYALLLACDARGQPRRLVWAVPLLLVWGNLHRGGTLGLVVLGEAAFVWSLARPTRRLGQMAALTALAGGLALMLNPGGWGTLASAFDLSARTSIRASLPEWAPLRASFLWRTDPAFTAMAVGWLVSAAMGVRRRASFAALEGLVVVSTGLLAATSVRFVPFAATAMVPGVARALDAMFGRFADAVAPRVRSAVVDALLTVSAVTMVGLHYVSAWAPSIWGTGIVDWRVPVAAASFLRANMPPGRMWNSFNYGGYLLFSLGPETKVFIDGRNDTVYTDAFFAETSRAPYDRAVLKRQTEHWDVGFAVLENTALSEKRFAFLFDNPAWQLVYLDDITAIVVRRTEESAAYRRRFGYEELRPDTALARAENLPTDPRREAFVREVTRYAEAAPESIRAQVLVALVARSSGLTDDYENARKRIAAAAESRGIRVDLPP